VELVYSQPLRLWSFCSPWLDPVVVDPHLAFLGCGGLLFVFLCYFFRFGRIVHLKMSSMGE
jgi:hypothetical protein